MTGNTTACTIYRSERHEGMYLYVSRGVELDELPEALVKRFGEAVKVMELDLHAGRKLARVDVANVMASLAEQDFFLQLPPAQPGREKSGA